jgi:chemotaxis protein CheX
MRVLQAPASTVKMNPGNLLIMKADFLNPFIKSTSRVVEMIVSEKPEMERVVLRNKNSYTTEEVAIFIGINGMLSGQVVISMPAGCACGIAAAMLMEETVFVLNEFAQSALSELANMIIANATIGLAEAGYSCDITPPTIITGKKMDIALPPQFKTVVITFRISHGRFDVNLSIMETSELTRLRQVKDFTKNPDSPK